MLIFHVADAPIARSVSQVTTFTLNLLPEPMISDQMISVLLIWQLGHVEKGPDLCAEPPQIEQNNLQRVVSGRRSTSGFPSHKT